jgi:outer membrane protein assembly factor BamB
MVLIRSQALALVLLCSSPVATSLAAAEWPSFRGPDGRGIGSGSPPSTWNLDSNKNLLWTTSIPGLGHSSPIIAGERIFLTTAEADREQSLKVGLYGDIAPAAPEGDVRYEVMAVNRATGAVVWKRLAHEGVPEIQRHTKATHANSTPATDGKYVAAMFGSEGLYVYDVEGHLRWKKDFGVLDSGFFQAPEAQWGFGSSPVIHGRAVIIQVDVQKGSFLAAYDLATGKELWRSARTDVPTWSSPTVHLGPERSQVIVNGFRHMGGYDLGTGEELWRMAGGGDIPVPTPVVWEDLVFLTSAHGVPAPVWAVRLDASGDITGSEPGVDSPVAWHEVKFGAYMQTPLAYDGLLYVCRDNGVLSVYEARTGELVYRERIKAGLGYTASMVAADGRLYVTAETGDVFVLRAGREFEVLAKNSLGEEALATPAIVDGTLYFRTRRHLLAIGN